MAGSGSRFDAQTGLIVVDVQNDFADPNGSLYVTEGEFEIPMLHWAKKPWHMIEESVYKTCAHILSALQAGREADTSGRDNLKTYAICEAAYESNATGKAVKPAEA